MTRELSPNLQDWIEARRRLRLTHAHVQMARELGMNPKKLGKLDNHRQEPWKAPLPQFIELLYLNRFGRERPEVVMSLEERARMQAATRAARRDKKQDAGSKPEEGPAAGEAGQGDEGRRPQVGAVRPT